MATCADDSKRAFISRGTMEDINCGSLQRIADASERTAVASETMAQNYIKLQADRDMYKRWYEQGQAECRALGRSIAALRGVITKLKHPSEGKEGKA